MAACRESASTCPGEGRCACAGLCTARISVFQPLSLEDQRLLKQKARHRHVPAGTCIFSENDPADQILVIHRGRVKLNRYTAEGREHVLDIIAPGGIYGEQGLFSGRRHEVNAIAMEDADYCAFYRADVEALILGHPEVGVKMLAVLGDKYARVRAMHELLTINDAKGRLAGYLVHRMKEEGDASLSLSRAQIAASINLRMETVSRKLGELAQEGLVAVSGHTAIRILNAGRLEEIFLLAE